MNRIWGGQTFELWEKTTLEWPFEARGPVASKAVGKSYCILLSAYLASTITYHPVLLYLLRIRTWKIIRKSNQTFMFRMMKNGSAVNLFNFVHLWTREPSKFAPPGFLLFFKLTIFYYDDNKDFWFWFSSAASHQGAINDTNQCLAATRKKQRWFILQ